MTISERIEEQVGLLNLESLTQDQNEWLHFVNTLATWVWIARTRREIDAKKRRAA